MRVKFTLSVFPCILEILLLSLRGHEADDDHERHACRIDPLSLAGSTARG